MSTIRLGGSERINLRKYANARKEKGNIQVFFIGLVTENEACSGATLVWRRSCGPTQEVAQRFFFIPFPPLTLDFQPCVSLGQMAMIPVLRWISPHHPLVVS